MKHRTLDAVIIFDRDVEYEELKALLPKDFRGDIVINGRLIVREDVFDFKGNLWVHYVDTLRKRRCFSIEGNLHTECINDNVFVVQVQHIEPVVIFEGNIKVTELEEFLPDDFEGDIVINGCLIVDEEGHHIKNNLHVTQIQDDSLHARLNLFIDGNLQSDLVNNIDIYVAGDWDSIEINAWDVWVGGSLFSKGSIDCAHITVEENLICNGDIKTSAYPITVGGNLVCNAILNAGEINVLGKATISVVINYSGPINIGI